MAVKRSRNELSATAAASVVRIHVQVGRGTSAEVSCHVGYNPIRGKSRGASGRRRPPEFLIGIGCDLRHASLSLIGKRQAMGQSQGDQSRSVSFSCGVTLGERQEPAKQLLRLPRSFALGNPNILPRHAELVNIVRQLKSLWEYRPWFPRRW